MILNIQNLTGSILTYLSGTISVPANSTLLISSTYHFDLSHDGQLRSDLVNGFVQLTDGVNIYGTLDGLTYLDYLEGLKDGQGKAFTSSLFAGKQALDVNVVNSTQSSSILSFYNEITSVGSSSLTTILTYNAVDIEKLKKIDVSGSNIAEYQILINSSLVSKKRTYFGNGLDTVFDFMDGIDLQVSDVLEVKVIHYRPSLGDFNATLLIGSI